MSATNKTLHYELPVYEPDDTTSWLQDFNGAMEKIDATMYAIASQGGGGGVNPIVVVQQTGQSTEDVMSQKAVTDALAEAGSGVTVVQTTGESETDVMSQKAVTDALAGAGEWTYTFKRCLFGKDPNEVTMVNMGVSKLVAEFLVATNKSGDVIVYPYINASGVTRENESNPAFLIMNTLIPVPFSGMDEPFKMWLNGFKLMQDLNQQQDDYLYIHANAETSDVPGTLSIHVRLDNPANNYNLICNQPWVFLHLGAIS